MTRVVPQIDGVSQQEIVLGVDTHKDFHAAVVITVLGAVMGGHVFPATAAGYRQLIDWAQTWGALHGPGLKALDRIAPP